ncbi:hypothetical protein FLX56_05730 [Synechococcus moorigangaii CMS01]|nr:hypothetical protein [Synechococcus moorigangaii CMS01]
MGRQAKLKKQRKVTDQASPTVGEKRFPRGDIETMTQLGYGEHNRLRSPEIPEDRPEPQL